MYCDINLEFIPIRSTGSASHTNSFSISTAFTMIFVTSSAGSLFSSFLYSRHAKSQCMPSSREMSSLLNVRPGIKPLFLSQ